MAQPMRIDDNVTDMEAADRKAHAVPPPEDFGVLIGWTHHDGPQGISLAMQSARSQTAWAAREIDRRHYLMTRNQALLLARYLLEVTGQELDMPERPHGWRAALARLRGSKR